MPRQSRDHCQQRSSSRWMVGLTAHCIIYWSIGRRCTASWRNFSKAKRSIFRQLCRCLLPYSKFLKRSLDRWLKIAKHKNALSLSCRLSNPLLRGAMDFPARPKWRLILTVADNDSYLLIRFRSRRSVKSHFPPLAACLKTTQFPTPVLSATPGRGHPLARFNRPKPI